LFCFCIVLKANATTVYVASSRERENYRVSGAGTGIHWSDIDENLSLNFLIEDYDCNLPVRKGGGGVHAMRCGR